MTIYDNSNVAFKQHIYFHCSRPDSVCGDDAGAVFCRSTLVIAVAVSHARNDAEGTSRKGASHGTGDTGGGDPCAA